MLEMCELLHTKSANRSSFTLKGVSSGGSKTNRYLSSALPRQSRCCLLCSPEIAFKASNLFLRSRKISVFTGERRRTVQQESTASRASALVGRRKLGLRLLPCRGRCSPGRREAGAAGSRQQRQGSPSSSKATLPRGDQHRNGSERLLVL